MSPVLSGTWNHFIEIPDFGFRVYGCGGSGFGFRGLGFRGLGFEGLGFRGLRA